MNTKPRSSLLLFAFGLSVIVATLRAAQTGFFHEEDFGWTVFAFCISFGITLVGGWGFFALPVEWHTMLTDVQYQATEQAKLRYEARSVSLGGGAGTAVVVENDLDDTQRAAQARSEALRGFYERVFRNAKAFGAIGWRKGFETVMDDVADWRLWVKEPLIRAGLAIPVNYGNSQGAIWRDGFNADVAMGWLTSNIPPAPDGEPPNMRNATQAHAQNKANFEPAKETS